MSVIEKAKEARGAALKMGTLPLGVRNNALLRAAEEIARRKEEILAANARDVRRCEELLKKRKISKPLVDRLRLSDRKLESICESMRSVAMLPDPLGRTLYAVRMDRDLDLYKVTCPIGVIGAIFESRPDVLPQISSLCLKSGNAVLLKGGSEARESNRALFSIIKEATEREGVPKGWIQLIEERAEVRELLKLDEYIDLLVPRGSREFIKYIQQHTKIPVLGHAEGICHIYVDASADLKKAVEVCYDAKVQYPAVCNAVEKILVHKAVAERFLPMLAERLQQAGVEIRGCPVTRRIIKVKPATQEDWRTEYLDLIVAVKVVGSLQEAVDHINTYGSKHTDAIVTEDRNAAIEFLERVDSSSVFWNASTRFSDGYRYGLGAEVGISTGKIHARGPVGLEGLTTTKYYLVGNGHVVADYIEGRKKFIHEPLSKTWKDFKTGA
ncbi:MAG: glutamate-5-semialdehyde dehydrogenase [Candidatus Hadarchaeales archaeon]